jgi:hypothetical protein
MGEPGRDLDFLEEPGGAQRGRELWPEHLDRDGAVVLPVVREIHRGHAPAAEFALDRVPLGEGSTQADKQVGQAGAREGGQLHHRATPSAEPGKLFTGVAYGASPGYSPSN